jgi:flavin reductase (DIM6/NTAB) family NADH-FMN oxidoreductase RutF
MVEAANHCCGDFPFEVDEMALSGLTPLPSEVVKPSRIGESAFHMECKHTHSQEIYDDNGNITTTVVFGRVVRFHVIEPLVEEGPRGLPQVNYEKYRPLGRIGGDDWLYGADYFGIARPPR